MLLLIDNRRLKTRTQMSLNISFLHCEPVHGSALKSGEHLIGGTGVFVRESSYKDEAIVLAKSLCDTISLVLANLMDCFKGYASIVGLKETVSIGLYVSGIPTILAHLNA
jgi:hypothetical protein